MSCGKFSDYDMWFLINEANNTYKVIFLLVVLYVHYGRCSVLRKIENCKFYIHHLLCMW